MLFQERSQLGAVGTFACFAQHPSARLVHEGFRVVQTCPRNTEGWLRVSGSYPRECGDHGDPALPQALTRNEAIKRGHGHGLCFGLIAQPLTDENLGARVDNVPN